MAKAEASTIVLNMTDEELSSLPVSHQTLLGLLDPATSTQSNTGIPLNAVLLATAKIVQHNDASRKALRRAIIPGKWYRLPGFVLRLT